MDQIELGSANITLQSHKTVDIFGKKVTFRKPKTFPVLRINGEIAMSASPQEVIMMQREAKLAPKGGRALVAGLGLGIILDILRKKKYIIHVVEKNPDVVEAYRQYKKRDVAYDFLHLMTIEDFLIKGCKDDGGYDFVHLDTWYNLDYEFLPHINWLIATAKARLHQKGQVVAWGYDDMVRHYSDDCLILFDNHSLVMSADPKTVQRLEVRAPMIGKFARWIRANRHEDRETAVHKSHLIAAEIKRFDVPLEAVDAVNWAAESMEQWKELLAMAEKPKAKD